MGGGGLKRHNIFTGIFFFSFRRNCDAWMRRDMGFRNRKTNQLPLFFHTRTCTFSSCVWFSHLDYDVQKHVFVFRRQHLTITRVRISIRIISIYITGYLHGQYDNKLVLRLRRFCGT